LKHGQKVTPWGENGLFLHLNNSKIQRNCFFSSSKTLIHGSSIVINGEMVERMVHFRYLGITLDIYHNFNMHTLLTSARTSDSI